MGSGWGPGGTPRDLTAAHLSQDGSLQCPTCKAIYGEKTGTQPPGKMEFHLIPHSLPGFADTQTIRIVYDIPTGIQVNPQGPQPQLSAPPPTPRLHLWSETLLPSLQGPEHPNPGKKFTARGFPRHCYLPNNEKGRKVSGHLASTINDGRVPSCYLLGLLPFVPSPYCHSFLSHHAKQQALNLLPLIH